MTQDNDMEALKPMEADEIEGLNKHWPRIVHTVMEAERRAEAAEREVERLREALTWIACTWLDGNGNEHIDPPYAEARRVARQSLQGA